MGGGKFMQKGKAVIAYEKIKEKILSGEFKPHEDISDERLQKELGISRTPIREALQELKKERFLHIYPRKGTIVSSITLDLISEVYEIRESLEPYVAKLVCNKLPEGWLLQMKRNFSIEPNVESLEERKKYYVNLDIQLHKKVIFTHNNAFIHNIMDNIFDHDQRIRVNSSTVNEKHNSSIKEHLEIIDAFLMRDEEAVERKMRDHIVSSRKTVIERIFGTALTR